jgi:hypothetical protein
MISLQRMPRNTPTAGGMAEARIRRAPADPFRADASTPIVTRLS